VATVAGDSGPEKGGIEVETWLNVPVLVVASWRLTRPGDARKVQTEQKQ